MKRKIFSALLCIVIVFSLIPIMPASAASKKYVKRTTSELGINFIEVFEGYYQYAYWDYSQYTIGYGSRCEKDEYPAGISEPAAHALLKKILPNYEAGLNSFLSKNDIYVTQNQYDALISFTYNFGAYVWNQNPTIAKYLKNGIDKYTDKQIADAFGLWVKAGGQVLPGLVERRAAEAKFFCTDDFSFDQEVYVVSTSLNIRKGPGTSYSYVASLKKGDMIAVTEKRYVGEKVWGKITYNKTDCWVMLNYAKYANDQTTSNSLISTCLYNAENTENGISLHWKKVNGADGYKIFRKEEGSTAYLLTHTITSKDTVSYVDKNVTQKQYRYYITAYKGNKSAKKSGICQIEFVKGTKLKSLSKLSNGFKISWSKISGATGYQILRRNDGDSSFVKIATVDSSKSEYSDTKAVGGVKYFYTVKAVSSAGISGASNTLSGMYIGAVNFTSASNTKTSVTINWSSSYNASGYYVYRKKTSEKSSKKIATVKGNSNTTYTDKSVSANTSYTYYVKAYLGSTVSNLSPAYSTKIYTPPAVNSITTSSSGLTVSWKAVSGIKKYNLYKKAYGENSYKKIATVSGTSYTDKTAVAGKKYYYRLSSISDNGTESYKGSSKNSWFFCSASISSATAAENGLKIAWKSVENAVSYSVYKYESKKYTLLGTVKSTSFTDKTLKTDKSRVYAVKVNYSNGKSKYSAKFTAYYLNTPKLKVKNVSNGLLLSWDTVKNAKGIIIYRKGPDDKGFKRYTKIDNYEKLTFENSTAVSGKKYSYKIKVINGNSVSLASNAATKTRK